MAVEREAFQKRFEQAKTVRSRIEARLDDCYRYAMPGRARFNGADGAPDADIYDETAVVALEDFASVMHSRMTPAHTQWVSLTCDHTIKNREAVNKDLEAVCAHMFERIHASNFSQEAQEGYLDLGCSVGSMVVDWRDGLTHTAIPMTQAYFEAGADDGIGGLFRERREVRADFLPALYPDGRFSSELDKVIATEPDKLVSVIDGMWRVWSGNHGAARGVLVTGGGSNPELVVSEDLASARDLPFLGFRFSKAAGEVYGRGPIMKVLSGIKTTNLVIELMLQNAAMAMVGMYHVDDDGTVNASTLKIEPGALIPRAPGSRGLERIDTRGQEFNVGQLILAEQRRNIRSGTFTDALGSPDGSPMKATEVMARMQEMAGRTSANIGRITSELIQPYIRRVLHLLVKAGEIELMVPVENILITPEGPLARAVRQQHMQAFVQLHEILAGIYGPGLAIAAYKAPELIEFLRKMLGAPGHVMGDTRQMAQAITAAAGAQGGNPMQPAQPGAPM